MKLEKFLFEVFRTCLWEEEGSSEHITEHVTHEDVIEITKQLGLDDIAKKFKRISKCSEEGEDCDSTWDKLEKIVNKDYFETVDKIYARLIEQPKEKAINLCGEECGFCKKLSINKKINKVFVTDVILYADEDTNKFKKDENALEVRYKEDAKDEEEDNLWFDSDYADIITKIAETI